MPNHPIACHLCRKKVSHIRPHLKNTHKWDKEQLKTWKNATKNGSMDGGGDQESDNNTTFRVKGYTPEHTLDENEKNITFIDESSNALKAIVNYTENTFIQLHQNLERHLISDDESTEGTSMRIRNALTPSWAYIKQMLNLNCFDWRLIYRKICK